MNIDFQLVTLKWNTQAIFTPYHVRGFLGWLSFLFWFSLAQAQGTLPNINLGNKAVFNFSKKEYRGATQSWDIASDARGMIYFANNDGLLEYNGYDWQLYKVDNQTIVRSVAIGLGGRIYTGAQNEFGYFEPNDQGCLQYYSLLKKLPAGIKLEDVWDIVVMDRWVYFRTNRYILAYDGEKNLQVVYSGPTLYMGKAGKRLFMQKAEGQLCLWENRVWKPASGQLPAGAIITAVLPLAGDSLLFTTLKNGLFHYYRQNLAIWKTAMDAQLRAKRIYHATLCHDGNLALATSLDGLMILDPQGRWLYQYHRENGLQHNNILCVHADVQNNLWLGLDNGISAIQYASPFSTIIPNKELESTGYAISFLDGKLYFGQSDGLYSLPWKSYYQRQDLQQFNKIEATDGQVWNATQLSDRLWVGHHEGLFSITGDGVKVLDPGQGAWTAVGLDDRHMLVGNYDGLSVYQKSGSSWQLSGRIRGLQESCRIVVKDDKDHIWVSHPYRGVYRVSFTESSWLEANVQHFTSAHGLPSDFNNYVFEIAGKPVFGTEKGVYRFDPVRNRFIPADDFNQNLGENRRVKYLKEDSRGNIWFVAGDETGLLVIDDLGLQKKARKIVFPELERRLVGGFEHIFPFAENHVFFATETGFVYYQPSKKKDPPLQLFFSRLEGKSDTLLAGNAHPAFAVADQKMVVPYSQNDLTFYFAVPGILFKDLVEYRCLLEGYDDAWTNWSADHTKPYTQLRPGSYTLRVQARIRGGRQETELRCKLVIDPPWYLSGLAIGLYVMAGIALLIALIRYQYLKFEREKLQISERYREAQEKQALQVEQAKAALVQMQNEKLAAEISFKNQELASATMHLVQKGEVLHTIKQALDQILEKSPGPEVRKEIQGLINLMNFDNKIDEDWEQFSHHFDQVHVNFMERLRKKYPQITANDEKLCAYLRLNLSTKETAQMMNISVRGVEASRYRLRKKLGLSNEENLVEFMMRI